METRSVNSQVMVTPSYDDFEPYCTWERQDELDKLVLHLPDFKKSELKIQINKVGILTITGERPVDETSAKRRRFFKQLRLSKDYKEEEIHAKLVGGLLDITMPKKFASVRINEQQQQPKIIVPKSQQDEEHKATTTANNDKGKEITNKPNPVTNIMDKAKVAEKTKIIKSSSSNMCKEMGYEFGALENLLSEYSVDPKVATVVAVAAAAAGVAIGAYLTYKCRTSRT